MFEVLHIEAEILQPKTRALTHRGELRGLKMRKPERGKIFVFQRESLQFIDHVHEFRADDFQRVVDHDCLAVAIYEATRRAEVYDRFGTFRLLPERLYVRHYVVAHFFFVIFRHVVIDIVGVFFHFVDLRLRDR